MISAQEARDAGPIADYIAVSRELQDQIWKAIFRRQDCAYFSNAYALARVLYNTDTAWHYRLVEELKVLGYEVSGDVVSW